MLSLKNHVSLDCQAIIQIMPSSLAEWCLNLNTHLWLSVFDFREAKRHNKRYTTECDCTHEERPADVWEIIIYIVMYVWSHYERYHHLWEVNKYTFTQVYKYIPYEWSTGTSGCIAMSKLVNEHRNPSLRRAKQHACIYATAFSTHLHSIIYFLRI